VSELNSSQGEQEKVFFLLAAWRVMLGQRLLYSLLGVGHYQPKSLKLSLPAFD
jgi:hypothetical protein